MLFGCQLHAPHGGVFTLLILNAVDHVGLYALSILIGTVVAAVIIAFVKRPVADEGLVPEAAAAR